MNYSHMVSLCAIAWTGLLPVAAVAELTPRQSALMTNNCLQCHARPVTGAPVIGKADDWSARLQKGDLVLLRNTVEGFKGMPPMGYCSACNEEDFRAMIVQMAGQANSVPDTAKGKP